MVVTVGEGDLGATLDAIIHPLGAKLRFVDIY